MIITIPLALWRLCAVLVKVLVDDTFAEVPAFGRLSILLGLILGAMLLMSMPGHEWRMSSFYAQGGFWSLDLSSFLRLRVNPITMHYVELGYRIKEGNLGYVLSAALIMILITSIIFFAFTITETRRRQRLRIFSASTAVAIFTAWVVVYITCALLWSLHSLNFWAIFLLILFARWPFLQLRAFRPAAKR